MAERKVELSEPPVEHKIDATQSPYPNKINAMSAPSQVDLTGGSIILHQNQASVIQLCQAEFGLYVVKEYHPAHLGSAIVDVCSMYKFSHPHIIRPTEAILTDNSIIITTQYYPLGDTGQLVRVVGKQSAEVVRKWAFQALSALECVHNNFVVHSDVKPENFLISPDGILLNDFGIAVWVPPHSGNSSSLSLDSNTSSQLSNQSNNTSNTVSTKIINPNAYSTNFRPPEVAQSYTSSADIWALGKTFEYWSGENDPVRELVKLMMVDDPLKRPTIRELLENKYFEGMKKISHVIAAVEKKNIELDNKEKSTNGSDEKNSVKQTDEKVTKQSDSAKEYVQKLVSKFVLNNRSVFNDTSIDNLSKAYEWIISMLYNTNDERPSLEIVPLIFKIMEYTNFLTGC